MKYRLIATGQVVCSEKELPSALFEKVATKPGAEKSGQPAKGKDKGSKMPAEDKE